ncbi:MAG: hypothetical protein LBC85_06855, partial [Fibromonadaceae bacterium]|nr:hypothetical protein [Fibromonadaceae bacterium]
CLLSELLSRKTTVVSETKISIDPYQRRLYENEPENLELRSLFAVMSPAYHNSYPMAIVLESKNNAVVSRVDALMLNYIAACVSVKLSDIQEKNFSIKKREDELIAINVNGLGELFNYFKTEIDNLRQSEEGLGILFLKCKLPNEENKALNYGKFLNVLKDLKKALNGNLAMLGNGEFVYSMKVTLSEDTFKSLEQQIVTSAKSSLAEDGLDLVSHSIWLNKNRISEIEEKYGHSCDTMFRISVMNKFLEMSGA